jgi:magnesium transporter
MTVTAAGAGRGPGSDQTFRFLFYSELVGRPVCKGKIKDRIGKLDDLVVSVSEHLPEAVGILVEHGWGRPSEFVPWGRVLRIDDDAIFVKPSDDGQPYPPFVDQAGWMLLGRHLMGRTVLDTDGRRIEAVNDVHLVESGGRLAVVHVDTSFNGFLRRWHLGRLKLIKDRFISWKYVQPLSVEDAVQSDKVSLSITRRQLRELPPEDLADALEELSGAEQVALFSALDSETAAEALWEAEPRAQRQLIAGMRKERAKGVLSEMSVPQIADLFSVLPHDQQTALMSLLPDAEAKRVRAILAEREATASALMSTDYVAVPRTAKVGEVLTELRTSGREPKSLSYVYVVNGEEQVLLGVVDLRELILAPDDAEISAVMTSPAAAADEDLPREELEELLAKYHFRMLPVVDARDHLKGVVLYNDIMRAA